ncbi:FG-GAP repeat protein [Nonomuraea sp. NPDC005692]
MSDFNGDGYQDLALGTPKASRSAATARPRSSWARPTPRRPGRRGRAGSW